MRKGGRYRGAGHHHAERRGRHGDRRRAAVQDKQELSALLKLLALGKKDRQTRQ
jgi:hypothetical protein